MTRGNSDRAYTCGIEIHHQFSSSGGDKEPASSAVKAALEAGSKEELIVAFQIIARLSDDELAGIAIESQAELACDFLGGGAFVEKCFIGGLRGESPPRRKMIGQDSNPLLRPPR